MYKLVIRLACLLACHKGGGGGWGGGEGEREREREERKRERKEREREERHTHTADLITIVPPRFNWQKYAAT